MTTYFIPEVTETVLHSRADDILPWNFELPSFVDDDFIPDFVVDIALDACEALVADDLYPLWVDHYDWFMYTEPCACYNPFESVW